MPAGNETIFMDHEVVSFIHGIAKYNPTDVLFDEY